MLASLNDEQLEFARHRRETTVVPHVFHQPSYSTATTVSPAVGEDKKTPTVQDFALDITHAVSLQKVDPVDITFYDLTLSVKVRKSENGSAHFGLRRDGRQISEKKILDNVTGTFRSGKLTAILGPSGSGKTSLLNTLSGSVPNGGLVGGDILINSQKIDPTTLRLISGYVFQDDVMQETSTVYEVVEMSTILRMPKMPNKERKELIDQMLELLEIKHTKDTYIGSSRMKGISGGERKRTAIAQELIINPSAIFLDEPTSGLDAYSAFLVTSILKELAHRGNRTVVSSIHQPSSEIFHLFDDVMILAEGRIAFSGPAAQMVDYFGNLGYHMPLHYNPADWLFLFVLNNPKDTNKTRLVQVLEAWEISSEYKAIKESADNPNIGGITRSMLRYQAGFGTQFAYLSRRAFKNLTRNKLFIHVRLLQTIFLGVFIGLVYLDVTGTDSAPAAMFQSMEGALFFCVVNQFFANSNNSLSVFGAERSVFEREYVNGYYGVAPFFFSRVLVELPFLLLFPIIFAFITFYIINFPGNFAQFLLYLLVLILVSLTGSSFGVLCASLFADITIALALVPLVILPLMIFGGFFTNAHVSPAWLSWIQWVSPIQYGFTTVANAIVGPFTFKSESGKDDLERLGIAGRLSQGVNIVLLIVIYVFCTFASLFALLRITTKTGAPRTRTRRKIERKVMKSLNGNAGMQENQLPAAEMEQFGGLGSSIGFPVAGSLPTGYQSS